MSSPHGSLLCSHWKCAAVVCEVNRMEHFRCCWKTLLLKPSKWAQRRRSLSPAFLYLFLSLSLCVCYPFVLISSVFLLSSYLISSCLFFFSLSLDRHVQSHHGHHKPFKCKLCPFKSSYASRLKSHLHKAHTGKEKHTDTYITSRLRELRAWLTRCSRARMAASCLPPFT